MPNTSESGRPSQLPDRIVEIEPKHRSVWLFPGQGTQFKGMGHALFEKYQLARDIYHTANDVLGYSISEISFEDPFNQLNKTKYTQPAIFVYNHACLTILQQQKHDKEFDHDPLFVAGNSLGEYNALVAAGVLSFEEALRLLKIRADAMQEACDENPSGLFYVNIRNPEQQTAMDHIAGLSKVKVCLINNDSAVTYGGTKEQIEIAKALANDHKLKPRDVPVDGAFHHPEIMASVVPILKDAVNKAPIQKARIPILGNTTAKPIQKVDDIRAELVNQVVMPVLWRDSLTYLKGQGITKTLEVGEKGLFIDTSKVIIGAGIVVTLTSLTGIAIGKALNHHRESSQN